MCSVLGIVDLTLLSDFLNPAILNKRFDKAGELLGSHFLIMAGVPLCHNRKLLHQLCNAILAASLHLLENGFGASKVFLLLLGQTAFACRLLTRQHFNLVIDKINHFGLLSLEIGVIALNACDEIRNAGEHLLAGRGFNLFHGINSFLVYWVFLPFDEFIIAYQVLFVKRKFQLFLYSLTLYFKRSFSTVTYRLFLFPLDIIEYITFQDFCLLADCTKLA